MAGFGVPDVELAVLVVEDARTELDEGIDVTEEAVDPARATAGDEGDKGGTDATERPAVSSLDVIAADGLGQAQEGPDGGHEGTGIVGTEDGIEEVHDLVSLLVIGGDVPRYQFEDGQYAKVGKFVDAIQQMEHDGPIDGHTTVVPPGHNLVEDQDAVGNDAGIGIAEHIVQRVDEVGPLEGLLVEVVHLERPHDGRLADVGVRVRERPAERFVDVLDHLRQAETAQRAEGQAPDHGIVVAAILLEGVGAHLGQLGVGRGVVAKGRGRPSS